ncbi:hypothetical protein ACIQJT_41595 [Streptomyces sp. NPDC091972]|uniref:hypothetical protein n=1 Tax=Streptomyces sp. NPDC091972 TaxID=3366007 RepID=UPI003801D71E
MAALTESVQQAKASRGEDTDADVHEMPKKRTAKKQPGQEGRSDEDHEEDGGTPIAQRLNAPGAPAFVRRCLLALRPAGGWWRRGLAERNRARKCSA